MSSPGLSVREREKERKGSGRGKKIYFYFIYFQVFIFVYPFCSVSRKTQPGVMLLTKDHIECRGKPDVPDVWPVSICNVARKADFE